MGRDFKMEFIGPWKLLYYFLRIAHMFVNNLMCIPSYTVWVLLLTPLRKYYPHLYWKIESILFKALLSFVVMWAHTGGYRILESGDDLTALHEKNTLLLVNHQSTSDIPCVMSALLPKDLVAGQIMWIMDYIFLYTNFGWSAFLHGDFFIQQGRDARITQLEKLKEHLLQQYITCDKKWVVLFPEGGFLYKRRAASQRFAQKNNLPVLQHVTLPRLGALSTILDTVGKLPTRNGMTDTKSEQHVIEWVVDMTLAYPGGKALNMHGICIGSWEPRHMRVHYRAYPISDLPLDNEGRTKWLYDRYVEKEEMLEHFYKNETPLDITDKQERKLPQMARREAAFDKVWFLISYIFYAVSAYIFWIYFYCPLWCSLKYLVSLFV